MKTALAVLLALVLSIGLVIVGSDEIVEYHDGRVTHTIPEPALIPLSIVGSMDKGQARGADLYELVIGLYPRPGIPWLVALVGGLIAPWLLLLWTVIRLLSRLRGSKRKWAGGTLAAFGAALLVPLALSSYMGMIWRTPQLSDAEYHSHFQNNALFMAIALTGLALAAIGTWLIWPRRKPEVLAI